MSGTRKRKRHRAPEIALAVQFGTRASRLPPAAKFRRWVAAALRKSARVTLRLVGTREGRELNRMYRGRDYATNVLTFIYSARPLEGDIAICAPVVAREAAMRGIDRDAHYAHLTVHGILHLQGFDHVKAADAARMENLETRILSALGYADPYRAIVATARARTRKPAAKSPPR
jgi:probable rRNA maturation factor